MTHTHMGMSMGVNPYPPMYMGDPVGLFLCRGYGYEVVIPGGYLPIVISNPGGGPARARSGAARRDSRVHTTRRFARGSHA
jgi:hypothetical protein